MQVCTQTYSPTHSTSLFVTCRESRGIPGYYVIHYIQLYYFVDLNFDLSEVLIFM